MLLVWEKRKRRATSEEDTNGWIGLEGTLLAQPNDKSQHVNSSPFPAVFGGKKKLSRKYYCSTGDNYNREERSQTKERKLSQRECRLITDGNGKAWKTEIGKLSSEGN